MGDYSMPLTLNIIRDLDFYIKYDENDHNSTIRDLVFLVACFSYPSLQTKESS